MDYEEIPIPPQEGKKFDQEKLRFSLLPFKSLELITEVLEFGAKKYDVNNWMYVTDPKTRYFNALMRHLIAWWQGEKHDPETRLLHLAHAGCCILFLLWFEFYSTTSEPNDN
jgi:hypothetical protein